MCPYLKILSKLNQIQVNQFFHLSLNVVSTLKVELGNFEFFGKVGR